MLISPDSFPFEKWLGLFGRLLHFLSGFKLYSPTLILKHFDVIRALLNIDHSAHLRNHYQSLRADNAFYSPLKSFSLTAYGRLSDLPLLMQSETYFGKNCFLIMPWTRPVKTQPAGFNRLSKQVECNQFSAHNQEGWSHCDRAMVH